MATFISDELHGTATDALERLLAQITLADLVKIVSNIEPCPMTGRITRDQIVIAMGEFGDIWPEGIRHHCESAEVIEFSRK